MTVINTAIRQQRLSRLLEFLFKTKCRVAYLPLLGSPGDGFYLDKILRKSLYRLAFPSEVPKLCGQLPPEGVNGSLIESAPQFKRISAVVLSPHPRRPRVFAKYNNAFTYMTEKLKLYGKY